MAIATRRSNVVIPANNETLPPQGTICGILLTAGAGAAAELTISNAEGLLGKFKVASASSQDFAIELKYDSELTFGLSGAGAEAYIYLEI